MLLALAMSAVVVSASPPGLVKLASFDNDKDSTLFWEVQTDHSYMHVGTSSGTLKPKESEKLGVFNGTVDFVDQIKAPGFVTAVGVKTHESFPDISGYIDKGFFVIRARTQSPAYSGFRVAFHTRHMEPSRFFPSFKASFNITGKYPQFDIVSLNFSAFTSDWDPYTGGCGNKDPNTGHQYYCCAKDSEEVCVTSDQLKEIEDIEIWAEGSDGLFQLEIDYIGVAMAHK